MPHPAAIATDAACDRIAPPSDILAVKRCHGRPLPVVDASQRNAAGFDWVKLIT